MTYKESMMKKMDIQTSIERLSSTYSSVISAVYQKIQEFGVTIIGFDFGNSDFTFDYKAIGRNTFSYDELLEIQKIVDPSAKDTHLVSVFGIYGVYTLRVRFAA